MIENINQNQSARTSNAIVSHPRNIVNEIEQSKQKHESFLWGLLSDYTGDSSSETSSENSNESPNSSWLLRRVHPFPNNTESNDCCNRSHDESLHPFNVFVWKSSLQKDNCWHKNTLEDLYRADQSAVVCRIENVPIQRPKPKTTNTDYNKKEKSEEDKKVVNVCVRLYKIEDYCEFFKMTQNKVPSVYVSQFLISVLGSRVGSKVRLTAFRPSLNKVLTSITLVPSAELVN